MSQLSTQAATVNFANDRADFEVAFRGFMGMTSTDLRDARTADGFSDRGMQMLFTGFCQARKIQRDAEAALELRMDECLRQQGNVAKPAPANRTLPINLIDEIKWGDHSYERPNTDESGIRLSYVKVTGNLWPVAFDAENESVEYSVSSDLIGAEYIDAVFEIQSMPTGYSVAKADVDRMVKEIMKDKYGPMIKTVADLPLSGNEGSGTRAVIVRMTVTHDDFMAEQVK